MLNNIPRPWKPDQIDAAARPGPRRKRDADAHPARSRAVRRSQRLHPARRTGSRPTEKQALDWQAQALKDVNRFPNIRIQHNREYGTKDSDSIESPQSLPTSPLISGPVVTPRTADDL
ncbi:hypothetical protein NDU88_000321 [Pleurodeles waltl]|uniref:Uncharacterized protein n=1 Tax=Pleurodeles waltl TaxID=8319 RepID=A0AAV7V5B0_PLEWA|nr:hypothetical protein NDU88_000321 [Pleurodeles waltl]